jgi:platelet-activating factor acetylhydrolase IB subunit alpha
MSTSHLIRTIMGHSEWVRCIVPSDDGRLLASGSKDQVRGGFLFRERKLIGFQTVRIWDGMSGESKFELRGHENDVECVTFAPIAAYPAIRQLAGLPVHIFRSSVTDIEY